ncbi:Protein indeterminate-domain 12 [Hibiscus syriacus]|uniref:Protein indeterminate-domain 12 n=1 Tax=Hibiscus syriacus TaxID=106335 RepID=A0A6A3A8R0_HIBSY|nr:protein indeterminate-domain 12-like [Hibiscus syriacus]KAE8699512.1 Protein indeterminate-domain 12 [Hibiscus syriacus]
MSPPTMSTRAQAGLNPIVSTVSPQKIKKKRGLPGNPDPDSEVIALSPNTLLATNRFICEICNKGFQRDQNLQLHRRGHNLPWKLKQRNIKDVKKKAYVCPEPTCVHHHPSRALGDLTGIKKHFCRKHGEKKWKCEKCSKIYAVQSDWKAHSKTCGTREYRCDCGTLFSRKDSFLTHRAFCDALAEESARLSANQLAAAAGTNPAPYSSLGFPFQNPISLNPWDPTQTSNPNPNSPLQVKPESQHFAPYFQEPPPPKVLVTSPFQTRRVSNNPPFNAAMSATALLQKATTVGACTATQINNNNNYHYGMASHVSPDFSGFTTADLSTWQKTSDCFTRDFLGLTRDHHQQHHSGGNGNGNVNYSINARDVLTCTVGVELQHFETGHPLLKPQGFGFTEPYAPASEAWGDC